jgi:hypothetical protein
LGDLTFTRASDATRTNSAGVIERTPWNLLQMSDMFADAYWLKQQGGVALAPVVTANVELAPNGTLTADRIVFDLNGGTTGTDLSQLTSGSFIYSSDTRTQSIYLRTTDNTNKVFSYVSPTGAQNSITVTPTYQRFTFTTTGVGNGGFRLRLRGAAAGEGTATSATVAVWGAQFVEGTDAKPYFATTNRQDVPRLDYRNADGSVSTCPRLLLEPQRTNSIRNSTIVGAVAGSPGTVPTNWSVNNLFGLTQTIGTIGTESGLSYIDFRFNGIANASGSLEIRSEAPTQIAASNSQVWTNSTYVKLVANPSPANSIGLGIYERNLVGTALAFGQQTITPTTSIARFTFTRTLVGGATVAFVQPSITFNLTSGATYDFTIRIAAPQMELGAFATTFIPTTTAAVTRVRDAASKTDITSLIGQTEGTLFVEFDFTQTAEISTVISISDGTSTNDFILVYKLDNNVLSARLRTAGTDQILINTGTLTSGSYKLALAYKQNDIAFYVNGVLIGTDDSANIPATLSRLSISEIGTASNVMFGRNAQAALFKTRLTNAQLAEITTL